MITNIGPHYRYPIFKAISKAFDCDFYLGDNVLSHIKTFDYNSLNGYRGTLRNRYFHNIYWQVNSVSLINKPYSHYILDGEPLCLSSWIILLLAKLKGKKTIAWTHGWYGRESFIKKKVKKLFFSLFTQNHSDTRLAVSVTNALQIIKIFSLEIILLLSIVRIFIIIILFS